MYFNLESNMLAYIYKNVNLLDGDTKHLVVSPPVDPTVSTSKYSLQEFDQEFEQHIEDIKASEITITFKPIYRNKYIDLEISKIVRLFMMPYAKASYILVPEYGDNYNLHYHGVIIAPSNLKSQIKKESNLLLGRTELKSIQYTQSYLKYCLKERDNIDNYIDLVVYNIKTNLKTKTRKHINYL